MHALTLKHPWPYCIVSLGKRIENRTWAPPRKHLDSWIAIHGGAYPGGKAWFEAMRDLNRLQARGLAKNAMVLSDAILPGIVCLAKLARVIHATDARTAADAPYRSPWFTGPYGWCFSDVHPLREPVACKGAQGLWRVPGDVLAEVEARWRAAR